MATPLELLTRWVHRDSEGDLDWFDAQINAIADPERRAKVLYTAIGLAPRKLGKVDLALTAEDMAAARSARPGWNPTEYSVDMAARIALILSVDDGSDAFFETFDTLWRTADVGEQVAFYRGLPLYGSPARFEWRATDGCRTNIKAVFEAIAHRNPYPAERFDEVAFNQMCLKALFVGSNLHRIQRLDSRHNGALARMMTDYAFERWAASRNVSPELWRCVAPHPDARCLEALDRALVSDDPLTRDGAALACATSENADVALLLGAHPELRARTENGSITWVELTNTFES